MFVVRLLFTLMFFAVVASCGSEQSLKEREQITGTLSLPLGAETQSGASYRLTDASFTVTNVATGASQQVLANEAPGQSAKLTLPTGKYKVELAPLGPKFTMLRTVSGSAPVQASNVELTSPAEVEVPVKTGQESKAVFHFLVDGVVVKLGGELVITIEVNERPPPAPAADASTPALDAGAGDAGIEEDGGAEDAGAEDAGVEDAGPARCGDGKVNQPEEECDDENDDETDGCFSSCTLDCICGDYIQCSVESCDDGNLADGDGCSAQCALEGVGAGGAGGEGGTAGEGGTSQGGAGGTGGNAQGGNAQGGNAQGGNAQGGNAGQGGSSDLNPDCVGCLDINIPDNLNQACSGDAECAAVRDCVVDSNCFQTGKSPSECYCGPAASIGDCSAAAFVPTGLCVSEIRAALTKDGQALDNASVVAAMAAATTTSGKAFGILIPATDFGICIAECSL
jgi:cysteine-rich repeat protein